jgi:integrase
MMGLFQTPEGAWGVDYRFPPGRRGKRIRRVVGTQEEAEIILGRDRQDVRQGLDPALRRIKPVLFKDHAAKVLEQHYSKKRCHDWAKLVIKTHLVPYFGERFLGNVNEEMVSEYMTERRAAGRGNGTINNERAVLSKVMSLAVRWKHIHENPVSGVEKLEKPAGRSRVLTHDEADKLIEKAPKHLKPIIVAALETGGRKTELLSLKWDSVFLDRGVLYFDGNTTKSGKTREIPITPLLEKTLRSLSRFGSGYVFTRHGKRLHDVRSAWEIARVGAGLGEEVEGLHVCRHTFCTWYASQPGANPFTLKELAGHADMATTMIYFHGTPGARKAAVPLMGRQAGGQSVDSNSGSLENGKSASA